ncbi:hypothetical protein BaRGS_00018993 [Batillaria attramentaria]|uniref:Uncharacterized protein n=1 Tax=Batillaria attramentaria TaxID=370345 RepID=A0ABD0KRR2_9CAEN
MSCLRRSMFLPVSGMARDVKREENGVVKASTPFTGFGLNRVGDTGKEHARTTSEVGHVHSKRVRLIIPRLERGKIESDPSSMPVILSVAQAIREALTVSKPTV